MRNRIWINTALIVVVTAIAVLIAIPNAPTWKIGNWKKEFKIHQGLDLQGGTQLIYQADLSKSKNKAKDLENLKNVFESRVNGLGVSESNIQTSGGDRIIIELPGIKNLEEAKKRIGATYELQFMIEDPEGQALNDYYTNEAYPGTWKASELTGRQLKFASVGLNDQTISAEPIVEMEFTREGKTLFSKLTKDNLNKRIAIVLDGKIVSAPTVQTEITGGNAQITGLDSQDEASKLSKRLNEGMLPVPAKLAGQNTIGPSLGGEAVKKSLIAGALGLLLVAIFMIALYRLPGFISVIALIIYAIISVAIFKYVPVTLTMAGIAGFILSVGMAVDANILIFERMKEELHTDKPLNKALDEAFKRAWLSVRDSNASSLITCLILIFLTTGFIRGFAVTLAIGILVSLFTSITVTRTFLRLLIGTKLERYLKRL